MSKKILLIEDNEEIRENTAEILELSGYEIDTAENGIIGVEKVSSNQPDLIICDVMMPELDGFGVLHILSKKPETASIPFIFLTAKTEKADFRRGMNLGADDYLTKPFDEVELMNAVEIRLKKSEALKSKFEPTAEGLGQFISEARGLKELEKLSEDRVSRTYKKNEVVFSEGSYPKVVFFVHSGKVKTFKTNEEGKEYITGLHKAGDFIGYVPLLEAQKYQESAMTLDESEIVMVPADDFNALIHNNRDVASRFIKMLSNDIMEKETQLLDLAYSSVRKRAANALILLHDRYVKDSGNDDIMLSREDLSNIVGTAKESVVRTLSDFKSEGLIEISRGKVKILNLEKLIHMHN